jgi:hypothetical protein
MKAIIIIGIFFTVILISIFLIILLKRSNESMKRFNKITPEEVKLLSNEFARMIHAGEDMAIFFQRLSTG